MPPSADRRLLPDKVAVVTGGAAGIGRATAELFAREGAQVMVADLDTRAGRECVARVEQAGGSAAFIETDVGSMNAVENLISATVARYGRLDVIHSNAYHSAVAPQPPSPKTTGSGPWTFPSRPPGCWRTTVFRPCSRTAAARW